jgi:hypothetical protein
VEDVTVTMRNIVNSVNSINSVNSVKGANIVHSDNSVAAPATASEARFVTPLSTEVAALIGQIFQPRGGDQAQSWDWVTLGELSSRGGGGEGGRVSQRLQMWLDDLAVAEGSSGRDLDARGRDTNGDAGATGIGDIGEGSGMHPFAARSRACGEGWLPRSPLPYNARTETEVHCAFDRKPIHRIAFTLQTPQTLRTSER